MTKKAFLLITLPVLIILFLTSIVFGQGPGHWDPWQKMGCYSGISFSVVNIGAGAGGYLWGIRFKNEYKIPVSFRYRLSIGEDDRSKQGGDVVRNLKSGDTWIDGNDKFTAKLYKSASTKFYYFIWNVCFDGMKCGGANDCYAECDGTVGKPNQPCGLADDNNSKSSSNENSEWKNEAGEKAKIEMVTDGLILSAIPSGFTYFCKKISADTYLYKDLANGYDYYYKYINENEFSSWVMWNGQKYFDRSFTRLAAKPKENKSLSIESGVWISMGSKANIKVTEGGLMFHIINSVDNGAQFYKKISVNEYKWFDPDGEHFCLLTVKSSKKVDYSCNGYSIGGYDFLSQTSEEKTYPDITVMNGEWKSDDGLYTVITKTRGNGFDAWNKNDAANKIYYNTISANEYRYTSPSGTKMVLKMMNSNRLESFQNGQHFGYFSRSTSASNETDHAAKNTSPIEEGEWVNDFGFKITLKFSTDGLHWSQKNPDSEIVFLKIAPETYRFGDNDDHIIIKFIHNNRFSFSISRTDSLIFYYNRVASIVNENKSTTAGSTFDTDIKKLADYLCKMQVLEEKLKKNENDNEALNEYRQISEEATNFTTNLEAKYTKEVLDSEAARKITLEEWKKCPVKVIIY